MKSFPRRRVAATLFAVLVAIVAGWGGAARSAARPGGGSSFSGSSHSSSSSSHSSSSSSWHSSSSSSSSGSSWSSSGSYAGSTVSLDKILGFAILLVLMVVVLGVIGTAWSRSSQNWDAGAGSARPRPLLRADLEKLRLRDPNFSVILLEDFLYSLYAYAHTMRANGGIERMAAYLRPAARAALSGLGNVREVQSIIVGAMRYTSVSGAASDAPEVKLGVEFEANYTEISAAGAPQSYYVCESWALSRGRDVASRTPDRARVLNCPGCGAPLEATVGGNCTYCRRAVDTGQFDWVVESISEDSREPRGPLLTGTTEEEGTDLATVIDPELESRFAALRTSDPGFGWPAFQSRIALIFGAMQTSWSNRSWQEARPFVSDNLFQMLGYWIETYKRARLRNITEGAHIERIELARVSSDKFYDAITVRLFASSLDFTVADDDGRIVGGSRQFPRRYSEYWTLIRSVGRQGPARSDGVCPSCGAPLKIEMAGHCVYCNAKVTSGTFDWVLSRIEQDEVYDG